MKSLIRILSLLILVSIPMAGCAQTDPQELELLKKDDPNFRQRMAEKEEARQQMVNLKAQLRESETVMDAKIGELKTIHQDKAFIVNEQFGNLKNKIMLNRQLYKAELVDYQQTLRDKKREIAEVMDTLENVTGVIGRNGSLNFSPQELAHWEERRAALESRVDPLETKVAKLEAKIGLQKKKLKYL